MSFKDGWAAMNLDMPGRIPRTEYSAHKHWKLVRQVTTIDVGPESPAEVQQQAFSAFVKAWNYDFMWSTLISRLIFGDLRTKMGYARYEGSVKHSSEVFCPFNDPEEVLQFDPMKAYGRVDSSFVIKEFEEHYQSMCKNYPDTVNMTGIYVTCISGLVEIFGFEMLLTAAGIDPNRLGNLVNRYASWIQQYFNALAESDVPIVMIHDDITWTSGPFLHPDWYRKFVFPNYRKLFSPLIDSGKKILFTSDGNYTAFIDDIVAVGVNGFILEPLTDMAYIAEKYGKTHVFAGNMNTNTLLYGTKTDIRSEVEKCINIGKSCPGFFMAVGNHIMPNTPVESALYYNQVYEELSRR